MLKLLSLAAGLSFTALLTASCAHTAGTAPAATAPAATTPATGFADPASACSSGGGKYLGDMKCQMPNGSIAPILVGAEAQSAMLSSIPVTPKSPHAWALATTAILFEFNRHRHDLLSGTVATLDGQQIGERLLSQSWGVNNRDELLKILNWLQFEGHRSEFEQLGRRVDRLSEQQFLTIEAAAQRNPRAQNQLEITRKNHRDLGQKGILAWDLVRYIALCRWGYLAGYLSDTEAWDHIMPAALRLQQTFASWQDLQSDFLIGREFWSLQQTQQNGERFRTIYERFVQDPSSPWNVNPWTTDLGLATPLPIEANEAQ
jgi:Protein of unknown function (DUF1266)